MIRGLVVGKFAPLHRGHEFLISTARSKCHELLILSYTSHDFPGCDAVHRRQWIQKSFPGARVVVLDEKESIQDDESSNEVQRAFIASKLRELDFLPTHVFTSEDYGPGFADHLSKAFFQSITHVSVDPPRQKHSVSATEIRANVHENRDWLPPHVYADFVERIAFIGAESTGKSSLGLWLSQQLETHYASEYGRELWTQQQGKLTFEDLLLIGQRQVEREMHLAETAKRFLVCDTTPLSTLFYCLSYFGKADPRLVTLACRRYDHLILLPPDFPLVQDGTRQDEVFRLQQHHWHVRELAERNQRYVEVSGSISERHTQLLKRFPKAPKLLGLRK
jgi:HTH-type transcriptional regulator, transcriptional repressor of NAD biosynthesis genes